MEETIKNLRNYIDDPTPENMFYVAQEYEAFGQTASAIGFYHQCAERTNNDNLSLMWSFKPSMITDLEKIFEEE